MMEGIRMDKPIIKFKDGAFEVSIWKNKIKDKDVCNLKIKKVYLDKNDQWAEQSISIFQKDIAKCIFLLGEGYRNIIAQKNTPE